MLSFHLNVLQSLMIVLCPIQQILFLMLVYHPLSPKITIFLRLFVPVTIVKLVVMMIYLIRLLKICDSYIVKWLAIIFKNCLQTRTPNNWKKSDVALIHKKGDKQLLQNYRPV